MLCPLPNRKYFWHLMSRDDSKWRNVENCIKSPLIHHPWRPISAWNHQFRIIWARVIWYLLSVSRNPIHFTSSAFYIGFSVNQKLWAFIAKILIYSYIYIYQETSWRIDIGIPICIFTLRSPIISSSITTEYIHHCIVRNGWFRRIQNR